MTNRNPNIRQTLLEVIEEYWQLGPGYFQVEGILREAGKRLGIDPNNANNGQAILTAWSDFIRLGLIGYGYNLAMPNPPFCHLTEAGRQVLQQITRDPSNRDGYLAYLTSKTTINPIAKSYLDEALTAYVANCYKAAAVMIGAASESLILELKDELEAKCKLLNRKAPKNLERQEIKRIVDAIGDELSRQKNNMPPELSTAFESYWSAFVEQIRKTRNEAGHPKSIDPVTWNDVYIALLVFPEVAVLNENLKEWIKNELT
jgi:hypothetical protein